MKKSIKAVTRSCMAICLTVSGATAHAGDYTLEVIEQWGFPGGLNNLGQVVGVVHYPAVAETSFNFTYSSSTGSVHSPVEPEGSNGYLDINDAGQILTPQGVITQGVLAPASASVGTSLNASGQFTGSLNGSAILGNANGQVSRLEMPEGYWHARGLALNNAGGVTGVVSVNNSLRAFTHINGVTTDLGVLPPQSNDNFSYYAYGYNLGPYSIGLAINDEGTVIGISNGHLFEYKNGVMSAIPGLPTGTELPRVREGNLNQKGQFVFNTGFDPSLGKHYGESALYLYDNGHIKSIRSLMKPEDAAVWTSLHDVYAINDKGQITVLSERKFDNYYATFSFLLTPPAPAVPEASAALMAGLAAPLVLAWSRRRAISKHTTT